MIEKRQLPEEDLREVEEALAGMRADEPPPSLDLKICEALAHLPPPRRSPWLRVRGLLESPTFTWGYRLVSLAVLLGILAGVWSLVSLRRGALRQEGAPAGGPTLVSDRRGAQAVKGSSVTFILYAPEAKSVAVVGNFNDWDSARLRMTRGSDGNWTARITLPPGQYEYQFVVDGSRFVPDPNALEQRDDGMGGANAVLRL